MRNLQQVMGILVEECAEVIQAVSKINRFGMNIRWQGVTNKQHLITEIGDLLAVIEIFFTETDINISEEEILHAMEKKKEKLNHYLPHE
jgi:NTP pyrophosphatase (non-canonical NTP hydrolase)